LPRQLHHPCNQEPSKTFSFSQLHSNVQVWQISLDVDPQQEACDEQLLDASQKNRASAFRFAHLRTRFIVAQAALRRILAAELGVHPSQLVFDVQAHGKPVLGGQHAESSLHFNLSHSGALALLATSRGRRVGVDIEQVKSMAGEQLLAVARQFSAMEQADLARYEPAERVAAFYRCWVRKESLLKGMGLGITAGLDGFTVSVGSEAAWIANERLEGVRLGDWTLHNLAVPDGYVATLAVQGALQEMTLRTWDYSC
jgi:4'-phosphopantetheinyl transferase